ncbi:Poly(A) polymerase central domain-containing protein [Spinellus fusiger]|nr:Poly(A) polymerase central domain-containing protein [Spinellus fusiger]
MSSKETTYYGVSKPLSLATSTPNDERLRDELEKTLRRHSMYESNEKTLLRQKVLEELENLTQQMVAKICKEQGLSEAKIAQAGGIIRTFGSYRLGVHAADADIDAVCIVPKYVTREHFFEEWYTMLRNQQAVKDITTVEDSFVPVIKFKVYDISVDLVCAQLQVQSVPKGIDVNNSSLLQSLNTRCLRSINGTRVADEILSLVPNVSAFRVALRCIKLWATRRAIYSNTLGFFGGVAWALLVARVCQLYPKACASTIVSKFFMIVAQWAWPSPVILKPIEEGPGVSSLKPWNPKTNHRDRTHMMPVITPAYPSMCATHNVSKSTKAIILGELRRAAWIVDRIMIGSLSWDQLFTEHTFFTTYNHYLRIVASSDTYENNLKWGGLVESRLRHLLVRLDTTDGVALAHPFVHGFDDTYSYKTHEDMTDILTGNGRTENLIHRDSSQQWQSESGVIYTKTFYVGLYFKVNPALHTSYPLMDITASMNIFKAKVESWSDYQQGRMCIYLGYVKSDMLPDTLTKKASPEQSSQPTSFSASGTSMKSKAGGERERGGGVGRKRGHPEEITHIAIPPSHGVMRYGPSVADTSVGTTAAFI